MNEEVTRSLTSIVVSRFPQLNRELRLELARICQNFSDLEGVLAGLDQFWPLLAWAKLPEVQKSAADDLHRWSDLGYQVVGWGSRQYPIQLASIFDPPFLLLVRGNAELLMHRTQLSIVGSRNADAEGLEFAEQLARYVTDCGGCVVSGLALGVDTAAHRGALKGGHVRGTTAVLGSGFDNLYPTGNRTLAEQIVAEGGVLVSQFEPGVKPLPHNFLDRNRVIAGLSVATVVVQAAARSGSLATARYALDEGRDLAAVPGSLRNVRCEGSNRLLQQGAFPLLRVEDIHQLLPQLQPPAAAPQTVPLSGSEDAFARWLVQQGETPVTKLPGYQADAGGLLQLLLDLELRGLVNRLPGNIVAPTLALRDALQNTGSSNSA